MFGRAIHIQRASILPGRVDAIRTARWRAAFCPHPNIACREARAADPNTGIQVQNRDEISIEGHRCIASQTIFTERTANLDGIKITLVIDQVRLVSYCLRRALDLLIMARMLRDFVVDGWVDRVYVKFSRRPIFCGRGHVFEAGESEFVASRMMALLGSYKQAKVRFGRAA